MSKGRLSDPWKPIDSAVGWDKLNDLLGGFHDGVVREGLLIQEDYVDSSLHMVYGGKPSLYVSVQFQNETCPVVQFRFEGLQQLDFMVDRDTGPGEIEISGSCKTFRFLSLRLAAERCSYRILGREFLGPGSVFGDLQISLQGAGGPA